MASVSTLPRKKTWRTQAQRRSFEAQMAVTRERVMARLLELRRINGTEDRPLPQEEAAHRAEITVRQWQRWEAGESMPYTKNLSRVAEKFGVPLDFFDTEPSSGTDTPDLMASMDGDAPRDIHAKLDLILTMLHHNERMLDALLTAEQIKQVYADRDEDSQEEARSRRGRSRPGRAA